MISGGTPATAYPKILPYTFKPSFLATSLLARRTAAAPSVVYDELPAVVVPPTFLNAGFSLAKPSSDVPTLTPSSMFTTTSVSLPSAPLTVVLYGVISLADHPSFYDLAALA